MTWKELKEQLDSVPEHYLNSEIQIYTDSPHHEITANCMYLVNWGDVIEVYCDLILDCSLKLGELQEYGEDNG